MQCKIRLARRSTRAATSTSSSSRRLASGRAKYVVRRDGKSTVTVNANFVSFRVAVQIRLEFKFELGDRRVRHSGSFPKGKRRGVKTPEHTQKGSLTLPRMRNPLRKLLSRREDGLSKEGQRKVNDPSVIKETCVSSN